ncbi:MAG: hypothetical protein ACRYFU_22310, partial [Janthinobacterium lividum]
TVLGANSDGSLLNRDRAVWSGLNPYGGNACSGLTTPCRNFLNPAVFSTNPTNTPNNFNPLTYGNIVKGSFVGPRFQSWDVSVIRSFPIREALGLQFRAEFFNVLNHTNLGDPQQTQTSSAFGRISSTNGDPRIGQLSLKLLF